MVNPLRVLIVEDEPLISMEIEDVVLRTTPSVVIIKSSVNATKKVMDQFFDFALLDIDVTNGKTYELARILGEKHVPYVFVSASLRGSLPEELQKNPFISKPFRESDIRTVVLAADNKRKLT